MHCYKIYFSFNFIYLLIYLIDLISEFLYDYIDENYIHTRVSLVTIELSIHPKLYNCKLTDLIFGVVLINAKIILKQICGNNSSRK